ncbi:glutathione S-transferase T3-like [Vicia villosa]|uniref:glutathione S-transferase T3-like n=1 Tax=Vicia villosa TaxID=3911 RepID=UPI00273C601C|nr:glutathione S-transferase T3-like [Vicia villosa]
MDPNHFHYQQAMFNFMQNYQNPNPQNSQIPPMPPFSTQVSPFSTQPFSTQVPPFSTQVGTEKEERVVVKKKSREHFTRDEDILLIQSWLNVSKDPIVGVDQKAESFWVRVAANYNEYRGQSREKLKGQLKCRWHRINSLVQKFVGCYKQAVNGKKSGTTENDIMAAANALFAQDQGTTFNLEYAWRLLKDEPKWMGESIGSSSKITKTYASEASSDNPDTPSSYEFNSSSPMERPMGQKAAKRKGKAKEIPNATQDARNKILVLMERLAQSKEDEIELKVVQLMMKDISTMSDSQRDIHEKYCNKMKKNMECS